MLTRGMKRGRSSDDDDGIYRYPPHIHTFGNPFSFQGISTNHLFTLLVTLTLALSPPSHSRTFRLTLYPVPVLIISQAQWNGSACLTTALSPHHRRVGA